jgi:hypothetical protein
MMRRIGILAMIVAVALAAATSSTAARQRTKAPLACPPGHTHLIAADAQAEVYLRPEKSREEAEIYGCAYGGKRSYSLGGLPNGDAEGAAAEPTTRSSARSLPQNRSPARNLLRLVILKRKYMSK